LVCDAVWLCKNRCFGGTCRLHLQYEQNHRAKNISKLAADARSEGAQIVTMNSSETSVFTRSTRRNISETAFFIVSAVKISDQQNLSCSPPLSCSITGVAAPEPARLQHRFTWRYDLRLPGCPRNLTCLHLGGHHTHKPHMHVKGTSTR
jgi:hypothetical protein